MKKIAACALGLALVIAGGQSANAQSLGGFGSGSLGGSSVPADHWTNGINYEVRVTYDWTDIGLGSYPCKVQVIVDRDSARGVPEGKLVAPTSQSTYYVDSDAPPGALTITPQRFVGSGSYPAPVDRIEQLPLHIVPEGTRLPTDRFGGPTHIGTIPFTRYTECPTNALFNDPVANTRVLQQGVVARNR